MATAALSPSRATDFLRCPLRFRFRVVDRLPEAPSPAAVRGTVVHAVLERLFDLGAADRTPAAAARMVAPEWERLRAENEELDGLFEGDEEGLAGLLSEAELLLARWFELEDPTRFDPAGRELLVEAELDDGLLLRGYVDRLDEAPDGRLRVVDYKTGRAPTEAYEGRAMFQLRFYALALWRRRGVVPSVLRLVYLGDGQILSYRPDEAGLLATERKVRAIRAAIELAARTGDWQPSPGRQCDWCDHHARCPAMGGTPPDPPADAAARVLAVPAPAGPEPDPEEVP